MEISKIKALLPLSRVLQSYALTPDRNQLLKCPFHNDRTPSLQVYPKTNTCYCFSANCKTHGKSIDVIDFIMFKENYSKHEAILKAKSMIDIQQNDYVNMAAEQEGRTELLAQVFNYFSNAIRKSPKAKKYLESRALSLDKTEVGYNSGQFHHGKRRADDLIENCVKYGLLLPQKSKTKTGESAFSVFGKACIVFALRNENGEIVSLYFRSTVAKKEARHFFLKNRVGLYPRYPKGKNKLIITESIIDAASLLEQEEIKNNYEILALFGTNGLTQEHQLAISKWAEEQEGKEIIFFLNGDEAGRKAVDKYVGLLEKLYRNLEISNVDVPENEDVNSLLQGHEASILMHLIEQRKQLFFSNEESKSIEKTKAVEKNKSAKNKLEQSNPYKLKYEADHAIYIIRGFKVGQLDSLKISLQIIDKKTQLDHRCKLDLYEYSQVKKLANTAAERLGLRNDLIENELSILTGLLEEYQEKSKQEKQESKEIKVEVPATIASKCIAFWQAPKLMGNINQMIGKAGITGEENNRILLFAIAASYKMPDTLHALIQGSSGSGKTSLMKIISGLMPPEDIKRYTRVTDNSFYNQDEYFFVHKLVCFEDLDGLKEDAQLAVRELISNEILVTSTSIKDANGSIRGGERIVRGPMASLSCTTKGQIYEDNISRCFLIAVDESKDQTLRIIKHQNQLAAGLINNKKQEENVLFIQNCIRLLKPYRVVNPFANKIHLPQSAHKIRRLNELYQSFVKQVTLLHQFQRKQDKQGRLISEKEDLKIACEILFESIILKVDELDGSLRQFFEQLKDYIKEDKRAFTQREVRQYLKISKTQMQRYVRGLLSLGYVRQSGGHYNRGIQYIIDYRDNHHKTRLEIRDYLENQLEKL